MFYNISDQQAEPYQTSLEIQSSGTWSSAAYNVLSNIGGAMANVVYKTKDDKDKRKRRVSSMDSSDGFEMIDKNEL